MSTRNTLRLHYQRWLRGWIIAQIWAFLIMLPTLARTTKTSARYEHFWSVYSIPARLACVVLLGMALFIVGEILRRVSTTWHARIAVWTALTVSAAIAWRLFAFSVTAVSTRDPTAMRYAFFAYLGALGLLLAAALFATKRKGITPLQWKSWLDKVTLFLSPMPVIFWGNMFLLPTYPIHHPIAAAEVQTADLPSLGELPPNQVVNVQLTGLPSTGERPQDNIYIFVFDAWCSRLTFSDGEVRPDLTHLSKASEEMWRFTQAFSPGENTHVSMPRFLFQRDGAVILQGASIGFEGNAGFQPTTSMESVFSEASRRGYTTYMVGWTHPYHVMLSGQADFIAATSYHKSIGTQSWHEAVEFFQNAAIDVGGDSLMGWLRTRRNVMSLIYNQSHAELYTSAILDDARNGQFAVFHLPVPHTPCCFGPQGVKTRSNGDSGSQDVIMFQQLRYTDALIGRFFDKLRANGKYEHSTIVLMSDHNWRDDDQPLYSGMRADTHVPLLIKFPTSESRKVVCPSPVSTNRLAALLHDARDVGYDFSRLEAAIAEGRYLSEASKTAE